MRGNVERFSVKFQVILDITFLQVLTDRRVAQLSKKPLQAVEFVAPLARLDPIYKDEEESFKVRTILNSFLTILL